MDAEIAQARLKAASFCTPTAAALMNEGRMWSPEAVVPECNSRFRHGSMLAACVHGGVAVCV